MLCIKCEVKCTNSSRDTFVLNPDAPVGETRYAEAKNGVVYVFAESITEAAKMIGTNLISMTCLGSGMACKGEGK